MKRVGILIGGLLLCLGLTGCQSTPDKKVDSTLATEDQAVVWEQDREKAFGSYDYLSIEEKEAKELLEEKFGLALPALYAGAEKIFDEQLGEGTKKEAPISDLVVAGEKLTLTTIFPYQWAEEQYYAYGKTEFTYVWDEQTRQVRLKYQEADLAHYDTDEELHIKDPLAAVTALGKLMEISELEDKAEVFKTSYEEAVGQMTNESVYFEQTISQSLTNHTVGRNLSVEFGSKGSIVNILAFVADNRS